MAFTEVKGFSSSMAFTNVKGHFTLFPQVEWMGGNGSRDFIGTFPPLKSLTYVIWFLFFYLNECISV